MGEIMRKTKDYLYVVFIGLILFLSGSIILGGIRYFSAIFIGIDFISTLAYFFLSSFITRQIISKISIRNKFVSFILPFYAALMYIFKLYTTAFIELLVSGYGFIEILKVIPMSMYYNLIIIFNPVYYSSFTSYIVQLLSFIIDVFVGFVGVYYSYRVTKRM